MTPPIVVIHIETAWSPDLWCANDHAWTPLSKVVDLWVNTAAPTFAKAMSEAVPTSTTMIHAQLNR